MRHETARKLFYNKYRYKIVIYNTLASIFRNCEFDYARRQLDMLQLQVDTGSKSLVMPRRIYFSRFITQDDFEESKILLREFSKSKDFSLRVEMGCLNVYSNDEDWLKSLSKKILGAIEFWSPAEYVNKLTKNQIIVDVPNMKYRITLRSCPSSFANWCEQNSEKIKIGKSVLFSIANKGDVSGRYLYVRDEKVLTLIELMIGSSIRRIDEVLCPSNIDK